jgi:hypothetical protein
VDTVAKIPAKVSKLLSGLGHPHSGERLSAAQQLHAMQSSHLIPAIPHLEKALATERKEGVRKVLQGVLERAKRAQEQ